MVSVKLNGLSHYIDIGKVNTVDKVENNTNIFAKQEYVGFLGVRPSHAIHQYDTVNFGDPSSSLHSAKR